MEGIPEWAPPEVDTTRPSVARVYDYLLGGDHNFAADREVVRQLTAIGPAMEVAARANREFLQRAVSYLLEQGIEQFLDIGSGIPTVGNVHETAQDTNPAARVVYVDVDPVAVTHAQLLLDGNARAAAVRGDVREIDALLNHGEIRRLIDFTEPVGVLMVGLLHFVPDHDRPADLVGRVAHAVTPGSYLALSHFTQDDQPTAVNAATDVYVRTTARSTSRSRAEVAALFTGFDLIPPGVVHLSEWRPGEPPAPGTAPEAGYGGIGRKP